MKPTSIIWSQSGDGDLTITLRGERGLTKQFAVFSPDDLQRSVALAVCQDLSRRNLIDSLVLSVDLHALDKLIELLESFDDPGHFVRVLKMNATMGRENILTRALATGEVSGAVSG